MQRRTPTATTLVAAVAAVVGLAVGFGAGYAAHSTRSARPATELAAPNLGGGGQALPIGPARSISPRVPWDGTVSAWSSLPPKGREIYVGIDDGNVRYPSDITMLQEHQWPLTFFIPKVQLDEDVPFWQSAIATGGKLEDHSVNHPAMAGRSLDFQTQQICDQADEAKVQLGRRPVLFRPPYGSYDATTLEAAKTCGMRAVVLWDATVNDGVIRTQHGGPLEPGDIVLMHFRKTFAEDFGAVVNQVEQQGLTVGSLEKRFASNALLNAGPPSPPPSNGLDEETGALPSPTQAAPSTHAYVSPTARRTASASPTASRSASRSASPSAHPSSSPSRHGLPTIIVRSSPPPPSDSPSPSPTPPPPTESPTP